MNIKFKGNDHFFFKKKLPNLENKNKKKLRHFARFCLFSKHSGNKLLRNFHWKSFLERTSKCTKNSDKNHSKIQSRRILIIFFFKEISGMFIWNSLLNFIRTISGFFAGIITRPSLDIPLKILLETLNKMARKMKSQTQTNYAKKKTRTFLQ